MIFLKNFRLLSEGEEHGLIATKKNIFNTLYPLKIFPDMKLQHLDFNEITIFYGGNGSGKTTLLNIISNTLNASRRNVSFNGELFNDYVSNCQNTVINMNQCKEIKFISSDDVFDFLLDIKAINSNVNRRKEQLIEEYYNYDNTPASNYSILEHYDDLKNKLDANRMTVSKYVRTRLKNNNIIQESNGETALDFWQREIKDNALYIIDEPENSLSAENQIKLKQFIEESARFYNCQFIIATHSPFLLGINHATVYDLDDRPAKIKNWTDLKNVRVYYDFFKLHSNDFNY